MKQTKDILLKGDYFLDLWEKSRAGDQDSFRELVDAHYSQLYNYGHFFTKDNEVIKDAIQDIFVRLWEKRSSIEMKVVTIYLIKSLRNQLINKFRKGKYLFIKVDIEDAESIEDDFLMENSMILEEAGCERQIRLINAIRDLPKRQQEAIMLKYYQGLDNGKIAEIMNISRKSTENFLYKALISLKNHFSGLEIISFFLFFSLSWLSAT